MERIDYIKYSRSKALEYQTRTSIGLKNGKYVVEKAPISEKAIAHIATFENKHDELKAVYLKAEPVEVYMEDDKAYFPYLEGKNVLDYLEDSISDIDDLIKRIKNCFDYMFAYNRDNICKWKVSEEFGQIFGKSAGVNIKDAECVAPANIDAIFENFIIIDHERYINIDYEWTFDFPVPIDFIKYRTLLYFFSNNRGSLQNAINQDDFLKRFGIEESDADIFSDMEEHFQTYVHGEGRKYIYNSNYAQYNVGYLENPAKLYKEDKINEFEKLLKEKDKQYCKLEKENKKLQYYLDECNKAIVELRDTYSVKRKFEYRMNKIIKKIIPSKAVKAARVLKNDGMAALIYKVRNYNETKNAYDKWIEINENNVMETQKLEWNPKISVVVPVYNVASNMLIDCIESVMKQTYTNWELCLVDDCSTMESVRDVLHSYENKNDSRIKIAYHDVNGHISKTTNDGIAMATGEFVGLMDCDDYLAVNALYEMAKLLNEHPEYDFIYSDEDKVNEEGTERRDPFFKPDWSPDTFMSYMYTCHFSIFRKTVLDELGGERIGLEGSQDYDLVLRLMEKTMNIGHVPKILYHWRMRKESTANDLTAKPYIIESTIKAKEDALKRRGLKGHLECIEEVTQYRVVYEPQNNPLVSIVIPSKDNYQIVRQCVDSVRKYTQYKNYEIIIVDNGSSPDNRALYEKMSEDKKCVYHYDRKEFNFSYMCNEGAKIAKGEYLIFLNDDIEIPQNQGEWLQRMLGQAQISYTGAVGAKLLYPGTNQIQHAGVLNLHIGPGHAFHKFDDSLNCYWGRNILDYNYTIVTGACFMVKTDKYWGVNGFDESFPVAYNDVELCFKLVEKGYYNVLRNDVTLIHHESISRGYDVSPEKAERLRKEREHLYKVHPNFVDYDPCYNPNLTQDKGDCSLNLNEKSVFAEVEKLPYEQIGYMKESKSKFAVDSISESENGISIKGWIYNKKVNTQKTYPKVALISNDEKKCYAFSTIKEYRADLSNACLGKGSVFAGFVCEISLEDTYGMQGLYSIDILYNGELIETGKKITI